jgi:vacuolar-type H+-ATPase subunit I/STV1
MSSKDDESELWNAWSSASEAAIVVDGRKLNDVLTAIRAQLEFLRKQQFNIGDQVNNLSDEYHNNINSSKEKDPSTNVSGSATPSHPAVPVQPQYFPAPAVEQVLDAEELQIILDRIQNLESDARKSAQTNDRVDKLDSTINTKLHGFQSQLDKLSMRVDANATLEIKFNERIESMEKDFEERIAALQALMENKLANAYQSLQENLTDFKNELNALRDIVSINEYRLKNVESDMANAKESVRDLQETIDYFPVKHLDSIRNDIVELYMIKAGKDELARKADESVERTKADITDVERLDQYALELTRRIDASHVEMRDGFGSVDAKLDKRMDKLAHWVLKNLRKEMRSQQFLSGQEEARDGTDIGKIKCLVCDQVVTQQRETDIVHGGPGMKNVLKPYHLNPHQQQQQLNQTQNPQHQQQRPRSASPPGERSRGRGVFFRCFLCVYFLC